LRKNQIYLAKHNLCRHVEELSAGRSDGLAKHRPAHGLRSGVMAKSLKKKRVVRQKNALKKETRANGCILPLPMLYYKPSSLNDQSFPSGIETSLTSIFNGFLLSLSK